ncbi:MAG: methyltransferase domain-containing protein [Melioribacteraceae bacterium]|nr:methyltransferase domain-containing protein [Melioribacteraceae bacterium]
MEKELNIFLPGLDNQIRFVRRSLELKDKSTLTLGSASEEIVKLLAEETGNKAELIVEDYNSLMNSRLQLENQNNTNVRLMDFEFTDFNDKEFDLAYTQGAISNPRRNKIVKEIKRILKPDGIFCVGEVVALKEESPPFILDIYESTDMEPLQINKIDAYYQERNFEVLSKKDLSFTLKDYYSKNLYKLKKSIYDMEENEKSYYKKLINMISHEAKAFLNQGADEFIGFYSLILKKQ